jgi:mannitol/fructose-specific phosphotransferase system IIA component (Ntr-type)
MKTKTGKTRLGPLNLKQLTEMLEKESKTKNKSKIQNRIRALEKMGFTYNKEQIAE